MTETAPDKTKPERKKGLTPGHWIAIATIAVAVVGGTLGWGLSEHNARLASVEAGTNDISETLGRITEGQARAEGEMKAIRERLDRIESNIDTLIQLHLNGETRQPAAGRAE